MTRFVLYVVVPVLMSWSCTQPAAQQPPLSIATGPKDATYALVGEAIGAVYEAAVPGMRVDIIHSGGSRANIEAVEAGRADLGLVTADSAYGAYTRGTDAHRRPHHRLRGVAVLFPNTLHVVTRADSPVRQLSDLEGALIGVGRPGLNESSNGVATGSEVSIHTWAIAGSRRDDRRTRERSLSLDDVIPTLTRGDIDVGLLYGGPPFRPVTRGAEAAAVRLLSVDDAALSAIRARYPFFKRATIPAGTYRGQAEAVASAAMDNLLVARDDLSVDLVYRLTRAFHEALPRLGHEHAALLQINSEDAPATPIPLHAGALRYYRELELLR